MADYFEVYSGVGQDARLRAPKDGRTAQQEPAIPSKRRAILGLPRPGFGYVLRCTR
jgi:hypothetical protein